MASDDIRQVREALMRLKTVRTPDEQALVEQAGAALARLEAEHKRLGADNAGLLAFVSAQADVVCEGATHEGAVECGECTGCLARALIRQSHPGAELLEENQRLQDAVDGAADVLDVQPEHLHSACGALADDLRQAEEALGLKDGENLADVAKRLRADSERLRELRGCLPAMRASESLATRGWAGELARILGGES